MPLEFITDIGKSFDKFVFGGGPTSYQGSFSKQNFFYPLDIKTNSQRPIIRFTCFPRENTNAQGNVGEDRFSIHFPCPANLAFNDSAEFQSFDGGLLGPAEQMISKIMSGEKGTGVAGKAAGKKAEIGNLLLSLIPKPESLEQAKNIKQGRIKNPNTTNSFRGNGVRSFQFTFKMVAKSQAESNEVKNIHNVFRKYLYGKKSATGATLTYPPTWNIDFMTMSAQTQANQYLPKIAACYCTNVSSTFNTDADVFHRDGAPLSVDLSISFTETRALNQVDIDGLAQSTTFDPRGRGTDYSSVFGQSSDYNTALNNDLPGTTGGPGTGD
tara:strand:- start:6295 stop:7272 length:978 start_codon:yes stop_codon:yes gene_type:complete